MHSHAQQVVKDATKILRLGLFVVDLYAFFGQHTYLPDVKFITLEESCKFLRSVFLTLIELNKHF